MRPIAAIKPRSELAIFGGVALDIGIQKQQIACGPLSRARLWHGWCRRACRFARHRLAILADGRFHGQLVDIGWQIVFLLPSA